MCLIEKPTVQVEFNHVPRVENVCVSRYFIDSTPKLEEQLQEPDNLFYCFGSLILHIV